MSSNRDKNYLIELAEFRRKNYERDPSPVVAGRLADDYDAIAEYAYGESMGEESSIEAAEWLLKAAKYRLEAYRMSGRIDFIRGYMHDTYRAANILKYFSSAFERAKQVLKDACEEVRPLSESEEAEDIAECARCFENLGTLAYEHFGWSGSADDITLAANSFLDAAGVIMKLNRGRTAVSFNRRIHNTLRRSLHMAVKLSEDDFSMLRVVYKPEMESRLRRYFIEAFEELKAQYLPGVSSPKLLMILNASRSCLDFANAFKLSGMLSEYTIETEHWSYMLAKETKDLLDESVYINDASRCIRGSALIYLYETKKEFFSMLQRAGEILKDRYLRVPDPELNGTAERWLNTVLGSTWLIGKTIPVEVFDFLGDIVWVYDAAIRKHLISPETVFELYLNRITGFFVLGFRSAKKYTEENARRFLMNCSAAVAMKKYGSISEEFEEQAEAFAAYLSAKYPGEATDEAVKAFNEAKKAQPAS